MAGVMMRDEDRADGRERNTCARELVRDAEPAIEHVRCGVVYHDVRSHLPRASRHHGIRPGTSAKHHELGSTRVSQCGLNFFDCSAGSRCLSSA